MLTTGLFAHCALKWPVMIWRSNGHPLWPSTGKIDPLEWGKKIRDIPGDVDEEKYRTLRENYDIGIDDEGILYIGYFGKCNKCEVEFSREISIETPFQPGWEQP